MSGSARLELEGVRGVPCYNFTDESGVQKKVTAIIVPICVTRTLNKTTVAYACSMALSCYCKECRYSKGGQTDEIRDPYTEY